LKKWCSHGETLILGNFVYMANSRIFGSKIFIGSGIPKTLFSS
jgi:hypothetical protein